MSRSRTTRSCIRARWAPEQVCGPWPNAKCRFGWDRDLEGGIGRESSPVSGCIAYIVVADEKGERAEAEIGDEVSDRAGGRIPVGWEVVGSDAIGRGAVGSRLISARRGA